VIRVRIPRRCCRNATLTPAPPPPTIARPRGARRRHEPRRRLARAVLDAHDPGQCFSASVLR
jgi:hypothetical protein